MINYIIQILILFSFYVFISLKFISWKENNETKRKIETRIQQSIDETERRKSAIRRENLEVASKEMRIFATSGAP